MTTAEVLREARALYAANPSHVPAPHAPRDGTYCPISAIGRVTDGSGARVPAYAALCTAAGITAALVDWNAEHTTDEVLAAFDTAIEATS